MRWIFLVLAVGLAGCKGKCRQLSDKLCDCSSNSAERDSCQRRASAAEAQYLATEAEETHCAELLRDCDCRLIDTPEGKQRCGLAR